MKNSHHEEDGTLIIPENIKVYGIRRTAVTQTLLSCLNGGYFESHKKEDALYNKAIIRLVLSDSCAMDKFLVGDDCFRFRGHKRDKRGRLVSVEAYLYKEEKPKSNCSTI